MSYLDLPLGAEARRLVTKSPNWDAGPGAGSQTRGKCQGTLMSQRIRPSLHEHGETVVDPSFEASDDLPEPQAEKVVTPSPPAPLDRSRLGVVLGLSGFGLLMQGAADALARSGHGSSALTLFLLGIAVQFAASAWRLTSRHATRTERLWVSLVLGLGLLASYVMLEPLLLDSFDELAHLGTLAHLLDSHTLFPTNSILPVSPYYPGLELATAATRWFTGLPLAVDQLVVLAAVRIVLVLAVFLVVERACHSSRAGGIGVLGYVASPQFYGFDAQYAYETIALAFAVAIVYLLFVSIDSARPRFGRSFVLTLGCVVAVVISHHVTGWFTVGFLVVWAVGLFLSAHPRRHRTLTGRDPALALPAEPTADGSGAPPSASEDETSARANVSSMSNREPPNRRMAQARIVGIAAAFGLVIGGAWTVFVSRLLTPYLGPVFEAASADLAEALGSGHGDRTLFKSAAGGGSPHWEIALILASALVWCLVLVPSLFSVIFKRSVRGGALRYIPAVIAATYPISVLANVSGGTKLVAERATTFIFFGVALIVGAWLAKRISQKRRLIERAGTIGVATVVFLGSLLFGIGPLVSLLPGPYRVGADNLSYGSPSLAVAHWADSHLPAGSHVAADKDNGVLLNAIGGVVPVTAESGLVNPELLFFDRRLSRVRHPSHPQGRYPLHRRGRPPRPRTSSLRNLHRRWRTFDPPHPGRAQQVQHVSPHQAHLRQRSDPGVRRDLAAPSIRRALHLQAHRWAGPVSTSASSSWPRWLRCCGCSDCAAVRAGGTALNISLCAA